MIFKFDFTVEGGFNKLQVRHSVIEILEDNQLLSLATITPKSKAYISTHYFCYDENLRLYILTPPQTNHSSHMEENTTIAASIFDSYQLFGTKAQGLQLFGSGEKCEGDESLKAYTLFSNRFPDLMEWAENFEDFLDSFHARFYMLTIDKIKLLDETAFEDENYITITLKK